MSDTDLIDIAAAREKLRSDRVGQLYAERLIQEGRLSPEALPEGARTESKEAKALRIRAARFPLVRFGDLTVSAVPWLIDGLLPRGALTVIFGESGSMKSFVAMTAGFCIGTGLPFFGLRVKRPGNIVYLAAEGHEGLARRSAAWAKANGVNLSVFPIFVSKIGASLLDPETMADAAAALAQVAAMVGPPDGVFLDTWAESLAGDENSTLDTTAGLRAFARLCEPYGCARIAVHHTGQAAKDRERGSYALRAAADLMLRVTKDASGVAVMSCSKSRDVAPPAEMAFELKDITLDVLDDEGLEVHSAVLVQADVPDLESVAGVPPASAAVLRELEQGSGTPAQLAARLGRPTNSVRATCSRLAASGQIVKIAGVWMLPAPSAPSAPCAHRAAPCAHRTAPGSIDPVRGAVRAPEDGAEIW